MILIISIFNGIMHAWWFGLVGPFPQNCIASISTGWAVSGLSISIARAVSLLVFPTNDDPNDSNHFKGAMLYFWLGAIASVLSICLLLTLTKTEFFIYYRNKSSIIESENQFRSDYTSSSPVDTNSIKGINTRHERNHSLAKTPSLKKIYNDVFWLGWGLVVLYIQTFLVFPAVMLKGHISFIKNESWQVWFIITLYNITDTISRFLTERWMILTTPTTILATLIRFIFIAFAFLSAYEVPIFSNDFVKMINLLMIGFTNGYIGNWQVIIACKKALYHEKELTSKFMSFFLALGILLGSIITSFGVKKLFV